MHPGFISVDILFAEMTNLENTGTDTCELATATVS